MDGEGDGHVVADDLKRNHGGKLGDYGIDFAGHDRGSGLEGGEVDFGESGVGAGREEAEIVGDADDF